MLCEAPYTFPSQLCSLGTIFTFFFLRKYIKGKERLYFRFFRKPLNICHTCNREGWNRGKGGRETQEGEGICVLMADSHCCVVGNNTTL